MEQTTARLRRTFRSKLDDYDSDDSLPEALDEEEQESLIAALRAQNAVRNRRYATALLALPLLCTLVYAAPDSSSRSRLLSLLSITSLLASAHALWFLPVAVAEEEEEEEEERRKRGEERGKRGWQQQQQQQQHQHQHQHQHQGLGSTSVQRLQRGPLRSYLPYLNAVLVVLLAVAGFVGQEGEKGGRGGERLWFALLPGLVCGVVVVAKGIMGSVDVGELEGLKYGYKGA